ncbi:MHYT domain-containing protein [Microbulbifer marinus]|uniref:MHYT domain-containing protein, NO-binding membrane sensor n=1 Tax=Microbulbifer marinus TaxID=658218 RepID=A0A1H4AC46_9GAMM|nr:MHYT domain-containing protein [Microbulbifer marinus]SEA33559.1 MHYT domain-containing protein, NO-binding membrane sensor [Microbulbifer marinus]
MLDQYNPMLVTLSYVISVLGSFASLQLITAIPEAVTGVDRRRAILFAGLVMGGAAIWSMHFIGMLALETDMPMAYDILGTLGSVVVAVAACTLGLAIVGTGEFNADKLLPAAVFMGFGVAGMHYAGMAAMLMPAEISYNLNILIISVLIAVVAAGAALWMAFQTRGHWQKTGSALVMGLAVCGMHYTGMAAASYEMTGEMPPAGFAGALSKEYLGISCGVIAVAVLALAVWVGRWYRQRPLVPA